MRPPNVTPAAWWLMSALDKLNAIKDWKRLEKLIHDAKAKRKFARVPLETMPREVIDGWILAPARAVGDHDELGQQQLRPAGLSTYHSLASLGEQSTGQSSGHNAGIDNSDNFNMPQITSPESHLFPLGGRWPIGDWRNYME